MAVVPILLLSIAPPQRNVSRMVRRASMRFAVDCHPIYFHLLDELLDGRVDLGTRVVRWPRRSGNWFSTVQNI